MMYRIDFDRRAGTARHPGFEGFGGDFTGKSLDPYFDVVRAMTDAGLSDGPAVFRDERRMACLTVRSLHACARRYRPTEAQRIGEREYRSWFVGKHR